MMEHSLITKCKAHPLAMDIDALRMLALGQYNELVQASVDKNHSALLVFLAASRNTDLLRACEDEGFVEKIKNNIQEEVFIYLWTQMHDDFMWLHNQNDAWRESLTKGLPWKTLFSEKFHRTQWGASLALLVENWKPQRMHKYPYALKYIKNPSERHVLEAACGKEPGYMKAEQIDAFRPGASQWFSVRKQLGLTESYAQSRHAFRQWFFNGVEPLEDLEPTVFEP